MVATNKLHAALVDLIHQRALMDIGIEQLERVLAVFSEVEIATDRFTEHLAQAALKDMGEV